MNACQSRHTILLALIISFLLHLTMLILFLSVQSDNHRFYTQNISKKKDSTQWAAMKAGASQFGAPVIFHDEPKETIEEQNDTIAVEPTKLSKKQDSPIDEKKPIKKKKITTAAKETKKRIKKKPFTLARLTQGFLEHIKNEGENSVTMVGQEKRTPTAEQLKNERYVQKLSWCLQNSFKINQNKLPSIGSIKTKVKIYLALNQNGSIKELRIIQSSGNIMLDKFTHHIFHDASSSFPPVPHYLPHNPYKIVYIIEVSTTNDFHTKLRFS